MTTTRLNRLQAAIQAAGLDGLALNPGPSLVYVTGLHFHLMERPVVLLFTPDNPPALVLPELESSKTQQVPFPIQVFQYGENPTTWGSAFQEALQSVGLAGKKIGVEPTRLRFLELEFLEEAANGSQFVSAAECLSSLRIRKDPQELTAMRKAVAIAQNALNATLPLVKIGMTERQLATELTLQLLRAGADPELPFPPIVASGPNSANPHAVPSNRKLQPGDLVVIDWGCMIQDYASDLTRTFAIAEVDDELAEIAQVVSKANAAGRAAGKPGLPAGKVDEAARQVIEDAGYGEYFTHRTGHGLGLEPHEEPYMFSESPLKLAPGMVYTVEPGIYIPGKGGVRIEDDVVVTTSGAESLSNLVRDLIVVG